MAPYILPVELIYRDLSSPKTPDTKPAPADAAKAEAKLTRDDVTAILQHKRTASAAELQQIINDPKGHSLTAGERQELSHALTMEVAQSRRTKSGRDLATTRLIYDLGYAITPFGLLAEREWFEREFQAGTKAILACRRHSPPQCPCWKTVRDHLYTVRSFFAEKSPESFAALKIWDALEEMETAERPELEIETSPVRASLEDYEATY